MLKQIDFILSCVIERNSLFLTMGMFELTYLSLSTTGTSTSETVWEILLMKTTYDMFTSCF